MTMPRLGALFSSRRARPARSPWARREDWLRGRVRSEHKRSSQALGAIIALVMTVFGVATVLAVPDQLGAYGALGFVAVGASLFGIVIVRALQARRFGQTWFAMASVPAVPGGELRGTIQTRFPSPPERGVRLRLTCVRRTLAVDERDPVSEHVVWRDEQTIVAEAIQLLPAASLIPVRFSIPADALESNRERARAGIFWFLSAEASLAGVDYDDEFEIPVFQSADSSAAGPAPALTPPAAPVSPVGVTAADLARVRIVVGPVPGGTDFRFAAARTPLTAFGVTVFTVFWTAFLWLMFMSGAVIFAIPFALVELFLIMLLLDQWFASIRITIAGGELRTRYSLLGVPVYTWRRPTSDVVRFSIAVGTQEGGRGGTVYYDIGAILQNGSERKLAQHVRDKRHAEWLVATMTAALSRTSP